MTTRRRPGPTRKWAARASVATDYFFLPFLPFFFLSFFLSFFLATARLLPAGASDAQSLARETRAGKARNPRA